MALVTVQRSTSAASSPQCSKSDSETEEEDASRVRKNSSESFFAAEESEKSPLVLDLKDISQQHSERRLSTDSTISTNSTQSNNSDIQQHLQSMFYLLRHGETLKMAVKLESQRPNRTRYLVITSRNCCHTLTTERKNKSGRNISIKSTSITATTTTTTSSTTCVLRQTSVDSNKPAAQIEPESLESNEKQRLSGILNSEISRCTLKLETGKSNDCDSSDGTEESCLLGIDCNERATIGLVVPILADTTIHLDGDGGFSVAVYGKTHIFKPVSVQAMWSALQTLHKVSQKARENNFYPGGPSHEWLSYYENRIESDQSCLNEWNAMDAIESRRPPSPDAIRNKPTEKEETESVIKMKLKEIMMSVDLDEVTSKYIRGRLEEQLDMDLGEYKSFIDQEMLIILGQMDAPTEIFDHVYLGSEWNASNLEELQKNGVRHILNVTREIDNFFPGMFDYFNVRVYDDEKTNLLKHWDNTYRYINRAKDEGSKVLVHCKMGVSRSASVVIAYAMKAYNWEFQKAMQHVKERRNCIKPNKNFLNQLETYRGMLDAMKNKEKLQRSKSETNLKSTKDARLLPGSEPTPLIQALNQSKSKSKTRGVSGDGGDVEISGGIVNVSTLCSGNDHKHRKIMRRSSSTSPKGLQSHTTIVIKQQSQSLENLTPERNIVDEPKNVRFPGNNGENYSVTQNQVLHIQKNTPIPRVNTASTSVKTIISDLESFKERKSVNDRKLLNLQLSRSASVDVSNSKPDADSEYQAQKNVSAKTSCSPVWTSSAKLITQISTLSSQSACEATTSTTTSRNSIRLRRDTNCSGSGDMFSSQLDNVFEKEEVKQTRKTQSWAASTGGIILDHIPIQSQVHCGNIACSRKSSSSSIDSSGIINQCEGFVNVRTRQRELPFRHSSWGSGDQRNSLPMRNSSWSAYDANRNSFQYGGSAATAAAIIEGQIHELSKSNKTVSGSFSSVSKLNSGHQNKEPQIGTVKRTKQKLEESTVLKKLCHGNGSELLPAAGTAGQKRYSNLYRSQSAASSSRCRFSNRCSSEEFVSSSGVAQQRRLIRRSDGSKPLRSELFSASAPESYTISDIENKNTLQHNPANTDDQRISGNVQILKKNFELKAGNSNRSVPTSKKGHQSLPSSPVAQHVDHISSHTAAVTLSTANNYFNTQTNSVNRTCHLPTNASSATISEPSADHNVKGLVHKYQSSSSSSEKASNSSNHSLTNANNTITNTSIRTRPRSYYENRHCASSTEVPQRTMAKLPPPHVYNESKPPPAPLKSNNCSIISSSVTVAHPQTITENILAHHQQRRVQQHGKTHPLARLSLPKQNFNTAAYNTM